VLQSGEARRIVLGDWYQTDSVLVLDERGPTLTRVADVVGTRPTIAVERASRATP